MSTPMTAHTIINALMSKDDEHLKKLVFCNEEAEHPAIWYKIVLPDMAKRKSITDDMLVDMINEIAFVKKVECDSSTGYILIMELVECIRPKAISFCIERGVFANDIYTYLSNIKNASKYEKIVSGLSENAKAIICILKV